MRDEMSATSLKTPESFLSWDDGGNNDGLVEVVGSGVRDRAVVGSSVSSLTLK